MKDFLIKFYNYYIYYNRYSGRQNFEAAQNKAFIKTGLLVGIFFFFIYLFLMNILNRTIFGLPNDGISALLFVVPYLFSAFLIIRNYLKSTLHLSENLDQFEPAQLKKAYRFQVRIAILLGIYGALMFSLTRLTNIYIF